MELDVLNMDGKKVSSIELSAVIFEAPINVDLMHQAYVRQMSNARLGTHSTKGRSQVSGGGRKPWRQKGTGRARQGCLVAPQFRGGGIVFGPKPKFDQHVRINKKERKLAIRSLIGEKMRSNRFFVLESISMEEPKTKTLANFLQEVGLGKRVLFLGEGKIENVEVADKKVAVNVKSNDHKNFAKSVSNLPKTRFAFAKNINGYDLMLADDIVVTEAALEEINQWLA